MVEAPAAQGPQHATLASTAAARTHKLAKGTKTPPAPQRTAASTLGEAWRADAGQRASRCLLQEGTVTLTGSRTITTLRLCSARIGLQMPLPEHAEPYVAGEAHA